MDGNLVRCDATNVSYNGSGAACGVRNGSGVVTELVLEPYSLTHLLVTAIILGTVILVTIVGNVFVIAAIILERNLHNVANYLITSLAVADLMVAALVMPLAAVNEVSTQWFLGPEVCDMWSSTDVLCCTSSILHLVAIATDRYWAVTSVDYIRNRSAKRILSMIAGIWTISIAISIPPLFGWKNPEHSPTLTGQCMISQEIGYAVFATVGSFYLPLIVMLGIYIKIFRAVRFRIRKKHFKALNKGGTPKPLLGKQNGQGSRSPVQNYEPENTFPTKAECETNGSATTPLNDANRNTKHQLSPPHSPLLKDSPQKGSLLDITKVYLDIRKSGGGGGGGGSPKRKENLREKIEQKRERKAARTLGIITGTFVVCWLPFFIVTIVMPVCKDACAYPDILLSIIGWLGYCNSLLNPIIYTIFNPDFRNAFRKILFGKYRHRHRR